MSTTTRRTFLKTAPVAAAVAATVRTAAEPHDPLLDAIRAYRAGMADFLANAPEDDGDAETAYFASVVSPPNRVLREWGEPARTRGGAIEALRFAIEEHDKGDTPVIACMVNAALGYLEGVS